MKTLTKIILGICISSTAVALRDTDTWKISGNSMEPVLSDGDRVMVESFPFLKYRLGHNDLVIFRYPLDEKEILVKRIVYGSGEYVPYINRRLSDREYWVEGFTRNSIDSRLFGPITDEYVIGKVLYKE